MEYRMYSDYDDTYDDVLIGKTTDRGFKMVSYRKDSGLPNTRDEWEDLLEDEDVYIEDGDGRRVTSDEMFRLFETTYTAVRG